MQNKKQKLFTSNRRIGEHLLDVVMTPAVNITQVSAQNKVVRCPNEYTNTYSSDKDGSG